MAASQGRRVAVFAAIHTHYLTQNSTFSSHALPEQDYALVTYAPLICVVTIIFMGAVVTMACVLLRQKQKRIQEATSLTNLPWVETLQIFTVSGTDGAPALYVPRAAIAPPASPTPPGPPPSYELVVSDGTAKDAIRQMKSAAAANHIEVKEAAKEPEEKPEEEEGLPTYEDAVQMSLH